MKNRHWFLLILGVVATVIYLPHWFLIRYPLPAEGQVLLGGKPYFGPYVDYASLFEPFADFVRRQFQETHTLPLWNTYALLGLPMIEQSEHSILNPFQWLLWAGEHDWRIGITCLYLTWGAWGLFRLLTTGLGQPRALSFATAVLYALAGASPHALGDFCCLMHVMCLPHVVHHAAALAARPRRQIGHFLQLLAYVTVLMLTGQPQYLLVGGLAVVFLLFVYICLVRKPAVLLVYGGTGLVGLLLAAPMLAPFLEANLSGMAYPGNHQLVGSASYWKINLVTFSQVFSHRLTGYVGTTWYGATQPGLALSYESFSIAFGAVGALAALAGSIAALRHVVRRRASPIGALRAAAGLTALTMLGLLFLHNLSTDDSYPWFFRFVNLAKYAPPALALVLCMGIPSGLRLLIHGTRGLRVLLCLTGFLIPAVFLALIVRQNAPVLHQQLMEYCLLVTFLPLLGLAATAVAMRQQPPEAVQRMLALLLLVETLWLASWGMPFPYEWGRVIAIGVIAGFVLAAPHWPRARVPIAGAITLLCLAGLIVVRLATTGNVSKHTYDQELEAFSTRQEASSGYKPRLLTARSMMLYPWNSGYEVRALLSRCPVIPLATQALLFDYVDPTQLEQTQRRLSFLEFHGAVPLDSTDYLSWRNFVEKPELLDLLGIDYVADFDSGPLAKNPSLLQESLGKSETLAHGIFLRGRIVPAGKIGFFPKFATVAFTPDAWNVRRIWRASPDGRPHEHVVEIDSRQAPKWEGVVKSSWFDFEGNAAAAAAVTHMADGNGRFTADVSTDGAGLLLFREQYWPGWEARINGSPQPIVRVDSLFQGLMLQGAGAWHVEFRYVGTLRRDLGFTAAGLLVAGLMVWGIRPSSRRAAGNTRV